VVHPVSSSYVSAEGDAGILTSAAGAQSGQLLWWADDLLRQLQNDPLWSTNVAELVTIFKALYFAKDFRPPLLQFGNDFRAYLPLRQLKSCA
jgi:hypothetical protein